MQNYITKGGLSFKVFLILWMFTSCSTGQVRNDSMDQNNTRTGKEGHPKYTNHLINETSPYLLQHAHNPVDWYPWGKDAFEKAAKENKLVLISIGYSSCHWCHVMERESYENEEVAQLMNEHYICIKVDREERPDVDQVYMNAVQLLTGSGGWPLNCFALPDGSPVYGGTYYPPDQWKEVLTQLSETFREDPERVKKYAKKLREGVAGSEMIHIKKEDKSFQSESLKGTIEKWKTYFDKKEGGDNRVPKFPLPGSYEFLLAYYDQYDDKELLQHVELTLDKMAQGGIYDHIEGGFARYSTDKFWRVPHFEKMLYDNAQLVSLYSHAYQISGKERYQEVVEQTLSFILKEMTSPEGGFYSSFDADSEGEEGKFYTWTKAELDMILGEDTLIEKYYNISEKGNWEHTNILYSSSGPGEFAQNHNISKTDFKKTLHRANKKLYHYRARRVKPALDDKILTSWNALMLKGFIDAYRVFDRKEYMDAAIKNGHFLLKQINKEGVLYRNFKEKKSSIGGFLDDYSFTIQSFIDLYQATFDRSWLDHANELTRFVLAHFYDSRSGMFFYTSDLDDPLISRKMEITDNVIPSSNSVMARNLYLLSVYYENSSDHVLAKQMLVNVKEEIDQNPVYYSNWAQLLLSFLNPPSEVVILGLKAVELRKQIDKYYMPAIILAGAKGPGNMPLLKDRYVANKNMIYVCKGNVCKVPVMNVLDAIRQIRSNDIE